MAMSVGIRTRDGFIEAHTRTIEVVPWDKGQLSNVSAIVRYVQPNLPGMDADQRFDILLQELQDIKSRLPQDRRRSDRRKSPESLVEHKRKRDFMARCNEIHELYHLKPSYERGRGKLRAFLAEQLAYSDKTVGRRLKKYDLKVADLPWKMDNETE